MILRKASDSFLKQLDNLSHGNLHVQMPNGQSYHFGGKSHASPVQLFVKDWRVFENLMARGDTGFAEDYRAGKWETNDLTSLLTLGLLNENAVNRIISGNKAFQMVSRLSYLMKRNTVEGSKRNIHAHYDLGNQFYSLWLDKTMTYSAALFKSDSDGLETAQHHKYDRLIERFSMPNPDVLEIGCGWGGFAERCADRTGTSNINGVTISDEQYDYAAQRLGSKANIIKKDYRLLEGKFDNIVSIEMFEAVGEEYWSTYFQKVKSLLKEKGSAFIQTITIADDKFEAYRKGSDVIRSMVFPGGMLPSPTIFEQRSLKDGLSTVNKFEFGLDYARTLEIWLENFDSKYVEIKKMGFDDGFIRVWRFYLASCIAGFRTGRINVMQVELQHAK
jgi:cyclopropane-fatty-acyl-phospholipid synthase